MTRPSRRIGRRAAALLLAAALPGASGCPRARPPSARLATADVAIREAEERGAQVYAAGELRLAREKLRRAEHAVEAGEWEEARRLAEQALVDAELAEAKAVSAAAGGESDDAGGAAVGAGERAPGAPARGLP